MADIDEAAQRALDCALAYPEAWEDHPWGESAAKVRKKVFVFLGSPGERWNLSLKLPHSLNEVLGEAFAKPTGYGLGRHGWVSLSFERGSDVPIERVLAWIDESYRAVAPKKLVKELDARAT